MTAPIWQQEEGGTRFELAPVGRGARWLALTTRDVPSGRGPVARVLSPIALLDPDEAAALRDALTAWLDDADDSYILAMTSRWHYHALAPLAVIHALAERLGIDRGSRLHIMSLIVGRDITSSNDLTRAEARRVIDRLGNAKDADELIPTEGESAPVERANAGGLAIYQAAKEAARQGRKTLRVSDLLALIEGTPTRKEDE